MQKLRERERKRERERERFSFTFIYLDVSENEIMSLMDVLPKGSTQGYSLSLVVQSKTSRRIKPV